MVAHARHTIDCDVLPEHTAAYLRVAGGECAFVETHTAHAVPKLLAALDRHGLSPEQVRWIVVTHAHLDHAGGAGALLARCPRATLVAHPRAARHLIDPSRLVASASRVYGEARFAELYGTLAPVPKERVLVLEDGATFELGGATFRVHHTLGHARHHFVIEDAAMAAVYTGDALGMVYPALQRHGARFAIASTSPTDFDPPEARVSLAKIVALGADEACLTHFDAVRDVAEVAAQIEGWIDRSERMLDEAAASDASFEEMTATIAERLRSALSEDAGSRGIALDADDWRLLAVDVELNAQGIAFVAQRKREGRGRV